MTAVTIDLNDLGAPAPSADEALAALPDDEVADLLLEQLRFYVSLGVSYREAVATSVASLRLAFAPGRAVLH